MPRTMPYSRQLQHLTIAAACERIEAMALCADVLTRGLREAAPHLAGFADWRALEIVTGVIAGAAAEIARENNALEAGVEQKSGRQA